MEFEATTTCEIFWIIRHNMNAWKNLFELRLKKHSVATEKVYMSIWITSETPVVVFKFQINLIFDEDFKYIHCGPADIFLFSVCNSEMRDMIYLF